ncbi:MAG: glucose 1-dehydrogenase [Hamadaea sp.]|nr:glucose 1-dehydrogenase [Hamadaea sp.]
MRALTVKPGTAGSLEVVDVAEPTPGEGDLLVDALEVGVCGTDREIAAAEYGTAPPGEERLVIGHESLGRVIEAPAGSGFAPGDLVVGVVRMPDPVPCGACAAGHWDMCRNGQYTEHGIKDLHGFARERWTIPATHAVKLAPQLAQTGVLMEPTSVVAKAWQQIEAIGGRSWFAPHRVLITGAGPIGLLAALLGVQRGLDVHVLDRGDTGPKPAAVRALGATYHSGEVPGVTESLTPDVIIEATGAPALVIDAVAHTAAYGIVCLTGVSAAGHRHAVDIGGTNRTMVLENDVVFGSVNANLDHYAQAAQALAEADQDWLASLITRRAPLERFAEVFERRDGDIKTVITLA